MHVNDFRDDREPTRAQWRAIAKGFCRLAGEESPAHRAAALELILRLEAEPEPGAAAAPEPPLTAAATGAYGPRSMAAAWLESGRDARSRTGGGR